MQTFRIPLLLILGAGLTAGCASDRDQSYHYTPVTERGVCATVIMPGQTVPMHSKPGCRPTDYSSLGGAIVDDRRDVKSKQEPIPGTGVITAPLAAAAYPVKKAEEAVRRASGGKQSRSSSSTGSQQESRGAAPVPPDPGARAAASDPQAQWERAQLEALERQIGSAPAPAQPPWTAPAPSSRADRGAAPLGPAPAPSLSIADELARLQAGNRPADAPLRPDAARTGPGALRGAAPGLADRVTDRDGDGRPDHWEFTDGDRRVRELFDDDGDGRPDRTVFYDPASGLESRVEEDRNLDGRIDAWIDYRDGQLARQRRDSDYDGQPDHWSFYRAGQLTRQEIDLNGDGYRNRVAFFENGLLVREREDRDGDGRTDRVTRYDEQERIRQRDEDRDGDGLIDTRSLYEAGRLVHREMVSDDMRAIESDGLETDEWSRGGRG